MNNQEYWKDRSIKAWSIANVMRCSLAVIWFGAVLEIMQWAIPYFSISGLVIIPLILVMGIMLTPSMVVIMNCA